jgi:GNAT superfamily N-acetyltransferase
MTDSTANPASTVREIDPADPGTQALLLPVLRACRAEDLVGHPEPGLGLLNAQIAPRGTERGAVFAAYDAARTLVNFGKVSHSVADNRTLAFGVVNTLPSHRGRGHGSALVARMKEWAVGEGCDRLMLDGTAGPRGEAFAVRHGGRIASTDRRSVLDLTRVDRARYAEWARPSAKNAGYRTVVWVTHTPEELLATYARAGAAIHDAPHEGVEYEEHNADVAPQRAREDAWDAAGLRVHTLAAVAPDGEIAGYTQVFVYDDTMRLASVGDTAVVAAHRGHGLGLRMKAEMSLRILELEPHIDQITTWNDDTNRHMLGINVRMGYEVAEVWNRYLFEL